MIAPTMDLTGLRYFKTIVQCGSLSAAARQLHVSQPTLSVTVQNLEEELGTRLLLRDHQGVTATSTGEELCRHAGEVLALVDRAAQRIAGLESGEVGTFVIGCHESLGAYYLPGFMSAFLAEAPQIELSLWNGSSEAVTHAVLGRQVDFGLVVNPHPHPELVLVELFHDAMDVFVAATEGEVPDDDSTLAAARERLVRGPLVFAGRVAQCRELVDRLSAESALPARTLQCGDLELVKSLALAGIGVALLPRRVARYGQVGKLRRLHPRMPSISDTICLVYRADLHRTRAAIRLKDALARHGRRLEEELPGGAAT